MKLGIVGLPNVGKSTLFNAITNAGAESANYPFCTIEPNVGMVAVPDERLDKLAEMYAPKKKTPAVIEFVDIAGLVKGASQGAGLGTQGYGCSPFKAVRELGSERRETVRSLSSVGAGESMEAAPSTRGPGWTHLR